MKSSASRRINLHAILMIAYAYNAFLITNSESCSDSKVIIHIRTCSPTWMNWKPRYLNDNSCLKDRTVLFPFSRWEVHCLHRTKNYPAASPENSYAILLALWFIFTRRPPRLLQCSSVSRSSPFLTVMTTNLFLILQWNSVS